MSPCRSHPQLAIGLASMALIAFEVLLVRLVSILLYPVATYLVISLALLGYGASGTLLSLLNPSRVSLGRAAKALVCFSLAVLASLAWVWFASRSPALAFSLPLVAGAAFAFGGFAVASVLGHPATSVHTIYFSDLLGGGAGAATTMFGLSFLSGLQVGALVAAIALLAASALCASRPARYVVGATALAVLVTGLLARFPRGILPLVPKELARFVALGADVDWEVQTWTPMARIDVMSLPGDSLVGAARHVDYKLVTQDGGAPTLLISPENDGVAFIAEHTNFGLPYWIRPNPARVLIIGLGGGPDLQVALYFGSRSVTAVELNAGMLELLRYRYRAFTQDIAFDPRVTLLRDDGRHVVQASTQEYDLIQLTGVDTTVASPGAGPNLAENYLYTVEAFREYYRHLTAEGLLSVSFPDVEGLSLRLLSTAWSMLAEERVADPSAHIVVLRLGGFAHLLVKRSPFTVAEVETLHALSADQVQGVYFPLYARLFGITFDLSNEVFLAPGLSIPGQHADLAVQLSRGHASDWIAAQTRNVSPATDDRPFFFVLDKWGQFAPNLEALALSMILLATATLAFMIVPLFFLRRRGLSVPGAFSLAAFFTSLGVAYIGVEVSLIQKLALLLGHPGYAMAVTLSALLASSGVGSLLSGRRWAFPEKNKVRIIAVAIAVCIALSAYGLSRLFERLVFLPMALRLMVAIVVVAVPGFLMGMPFAIGLTAVKRHSAPFVPWAWALNSGATVLGTVGALLLAMTAGFTAVLTVTAGLYLVAAIAFASAARFPPITFTKA
jgi:spermidine synthase